jgi:hypothetical protein
MRRQRCEMDNGKKERKQERRKRKNVRHKDRVETIPL